MRASGVAPASADRSKVLAPEADRDDGHRQQPKYRAPGPHHWTAPRSAGRRAAAPRHPGTVAAPRTRRAPPGPAPPTATRRTKLVVVAGRQSLQFGAWAMQDHHPQGPDLGIRAKRWQSHHAPYRGKSPQLLFRCYVRTRNGARRPGAPRRRRRVGAALLRARRTDHQPPHLGQPTPLHPRHAAPGRVHPDVAAPRHSVGPGRATLWPHCRTTGSRRARTGHGCRRAGARTSTTGSCTCSACGTTSPTASAAAASA